MPTLLFYLPFLVIWMLLLIYIERKLAAFIQNRVGPQEVGYRGTLQPLADLLKLIKKEIIIPTASQSLLFTIAPTWIIITTLIAFLFIPVHPTWLSAPSQAALLWILALINLKPIGIFIAGWASNNKLARLGALRSTAQFISYEIPLTLSTLSVIVLSNQLNLENTIAQQGLAIYNPTTSPTNPSYFLGIKSLPVTHLGGCLTWYIFKTPTLLLAYGLFFVSSLSIANKIPFDLAESESELVGGYHVEYSGLYFALLMASEYILMTLMALVGIMLFLGGWHSPLPNIALAQFATYTNGLPGTLYGNFWASFWLTSKLLSIVTIQMWLKWSWPRLKPDQMLALNWRYLIPIGLCTLLVTIWWKVLIT